MDQICPRLADACACKLLLCCFTLYRFRTTVPIMLACQSWAPSLAEIQQGDVVCPKVYIFTDNYTRPKLRRSEHINLRGEHTALGQTESHRLCMTYRSRLELYSRHDLNLWLNCEVSGISRGNDQMWRLLLFGLADFVLWCSDMLG